MKITDFLTPETVIPVLERREKRRPEGNGRPACVSSHPTLDQKECSCKFYWNARRISTTAIGEGVAIPHGKLPGVDRVCTEFLPAVRKASTLHLLTAADLSFFL